MIFTKEMLVNHDKNIEDQNILHINRLLPRATIIPAQRSGIYYRNKEESSFIRSLCGDYKFLYLPEDIKKDFYLEEIDDSDWDIIDVPSMWQYRGYGTPEYPNIRYSIPFLPPYVKKQNPVGHYRKKFSVKAPAEKTILHFGGVDNAFYVYLNGQLVGFSKGSRLQSEFDVTNLIRKGENLIAVKVFTYSDASYLEDQDMLLASGIFRDLYLIETRKNTLWDYRVRTTKSSISISLKLEIESCYQVRLTLDGDSVTLDAKNDLEYTFNLENPRLWSAEIPNLYDLKIELISDGKAFETHSKRVGIMHTRVEGNKFLVNDTPIYIKGVNRHENNAKNGRAITVAEIEADLRMIKANNLNAIRMAHYTNNPATYEIATELGLYVMDESDIETHGASVANGDQGYISKSPEWLPAYLDRTRRMLEANKNETCIFLRSAGNECGQGPNIEECLRMMLDFDPNHECMCVQYSNFHNPFRYIAYYPASQPEGFSDEGGPVLAIEYAHAMGNSPGTLEDYWDYIYTHEKMVGGFVWEFRSHGFYAEDENGTPFYKYGGDFADLYHWSNFTMDGFCTSDGTPKPTWKVLGAVSFPAYLSFDGTRVTIKNTFDFKDLSEFEVSYDIIEDGMSIRHGNIKIPTLAPHESTVLEGIDLSTDCFIAGARYFLNINFLKDSIPVFTKQFALENSVKAPAFTPPTFTGDVSVENYIISVKGKDFNAQFTRGMLSRLEKNGKVLLDRPIKLNFWRAHTDNDGLHGLNLRHHQLWKNVMYDSIYLNLYDIDVEQKEDRAIIHTVGRITADSLYAGFSCKIDYEIFEGGNILVDIKGEPYGDLPRTMPRIGVMIELDKSFDNCSWIGRGPDESYPDSTLACPVGSYSKNISDMNFMYDMPQETGNREQTFLATVRGSDNRALSIVGSDKFSFSFHDFELQNLTYAVHKNELFRTTDVNYLYIDYKVRGLGSNSCGPEPEEKYELHPHSFEFAFMIAPTDKDSALELSRYDFGKKSRALSEAYKPQPIVKIREIADCDIF